VVLANVLKAQFNYGHNLADVINDGQDVHRLIAGTVLGKPVDAVTKVERNSAKPISFGRPGGMGPERLRQIAQASYGIDLTIEEVQVRIDAYHTLCPELNLFLEDEVDAWLELARAVNLTPSDYANASGRWIDYSDPTSQRPQGWLGSMLLKALKDESPITRSGREYSQHELEFFRQAAEKIAVDLDPELRKRLDSGQADLKVWGKVRNSVGRRSVFTITGQLRAQASFSSARNNVFQGPAADGAIPGMWLNWRSGYKIVSFVHDQVVVESVADGLVHQRMAEIESMMKRGMETVVPGMRVGVGSVIRQSMNK